MPSNRKTTKELRKFSITMTIAFAVIALIFLLKGHSTGWKVLFGISGFFIIFGLILPRALLPVEWAWMKLAHYLGIVVTHILVTLTFLLVITPMGLLLRLIGKDLLQLKFDKKADSYWIPTDPEGSSERPEKPY